MSTSPISPGANAPTATSRLTPTASSGRPVAVACRFDPSAALSFGALARRGEAIAAAAGGAQPGGAGLATGPAPKADSPGDRCSEDRCAVSPGRADLVDPLAIALASPSVGRGQTAPAADAAPPATGDTVALATRVSLEQMLSRLVRRIAWSGDAHTGCARIEFGAGALEGATLVIQSDHGALSVTLDLPPGVDRAEWRDRIASRLGARGLQIAALEVE
jgi:hypothetical protein